MTYRRNFFSYFNFLGISFCIFIAWASYFGYKSLVINGLLAFFVFCVLKCVMFAKFKNDILENDTPFLFKLSKSPTTSSTGGLILALQRAILLLAPQGGVTSTFTGPL